MIINYEKPFQKVEIFWELSIGNVFRTENTECFFMKVGKGEWDTEEWNAVRLDNGDYEYFDDNDKVIRLKAELNVKDD